MNNNSIACKAALKTLYQLGGLFLCAIILSVALMLLKYAVIYFIQLEWPAHIIVGIILLAIIWFLYNYLKLSLASPEANGKYLSMAT